MFIIFNIYFSNITTIKKKSTYDKFRTKISFTKSFNISLF